MRKQVQAVIFDMDGIIFDSERLVIECWEVVAAKHNIPDIVEICMRVQGNNREETGKRFREKYGKEFPYETYKKEVTSLFLERYGEGRLPLKPGVVKILEELKRNNIPLALASSTRSDIVKLEMEEANLPAANRSRIFFWLRQRLCRLNRNVVMYWKIPITASGQRTGPECIPLWCRTCSWPRKKSGG